MLIVSVVALVVVGAISWWLVLSLWPWQKKKKNEERGEKQELPLPPGSLGLPFLGETIEFVRMMQQNRMWKFMEDRVSKYGSSTFKTNLYGWRTVVVASPAGNKMAFANSDTSWPSSVIAVVGAQSLSAQNGAKAQRLRNAFHAFLNAEALRRYTHPVSLIVLSSIPSTDLPPPPPPPPPSSSPCPSHLQELLLYPFLKKLTFTIACRILVGIPYPHPDHESIFRDFTAFTRGIFRLPIPLPGTGYSHALAASHSIKTKLQKFIDNKRLALALTTSPRTTTSDGEDILSCLLAYQDEDGNPLSDQEIKDNLVGLLFAGTDTSSVAATMACRYLALHPSIMDHVYKENMEVAAGMGPRETLMWEDLPKLKLTWRVVQESMRLQPPVESGFRVASSDISFDGYTIPKSWKILWTSNATRRNPNYFPEPEKFDPSRFEGAGPPPFTYVPFGGGKRMCPGNEFARMEILVIIHYLITRFSWTLKFPDERITVDPVPMPVKGLPILLRPRASQM